ncbi:hypothetical protein O7599_00240 [Streptomyces sp. WMMC500]|nr:hypothetical protein [Streptomyces sp. WMMC500]WBB61026.1 hypothetical protein O7599_00240 [Streptomyces sp. WMMC500]
MAVKNRLPVPAGPVAAVRVTGPIPQAVTAEGGAAWGRPAGHR